MTKRRFVGVLLFGVILLATGVVPAGAAPAPTPTASADLLGPDNRGCWFGAGRVPVGTATIQSGKTKVPADQRALRVSIAADNVQARTTYGVYLTATVSEQTPGGTSVGCRLWSAGTVFSGNGRISFTGAVTVPRAITSFKVSVSSSGPGYLTDGISVSDF